MFAQSGNWRPTPIIAKTRSTVKKNKAEAFKLLGIAPEFIFLASKDTSSTAQGGGGSFKNRKPIGAVGCCESRMAE